MIPDQEYYDSQYAQMSSQMWQWRELNGALKAQNIVRVAGGLPIKTVLDVGCGTGAVLAQLDRHRLGESYYALDIAAHAIAAVKRRSDIPHLIEAQVFDGLHIPYDDNQFDLAVLSHVVEHLVDPVPVIREVARVARYVAVEVPLEDNLYTRIKVHLFRSRYRKDLGHVQWFNRRSFRSLLEQGCGLQVMDLQMVYVPDESYFFRKQGNPSLLTALMLDVRKTLRSLSDGLYTSLLTDHCIALARGAQ
jgi:ubiquinone/menaquinone biosynthesis C-methylase UbiE